MRGDAGRRSVRLRQIAATQERPMSTANHALVQDLYAAFKRRDVQTVLDALAPDVTWGMLGRREELPFAGDRHGKAGAADFFRTMAETVEIASFEPQTLLAAEDK